MHALKCTALQKCCCTMMTQAPRDECTKAGQSTARAGAFTDHAKAACPLPPWPVGASSGSSTNFFLRYLLGSALTFAVRGFRVRLGLG
jgi:hypothetical protein